MPKVATLKPAHFDHGQWLTEAKQQTMANLRSNHNGESSGHLCRTGSPVCAKTAAPYSSRSSEVAVRGDSACRFAADINLPRPKYSGFVWESNGVQALLGDEDQSEVLFERWQDNGRSDCLSTCPTVAPPNMFGSNLTYHRQSTAALSIESQVSVSSRGAKLLPDWVYPKWAKAFLPTLTHALYISKDPLEEFRSSSPTFIVTIEKTFRLVYPHVNYEITEDDVLVEEAARRLAAKRSKIAAAALEEVKHFFEQPQFANHPDKIKAYARWALLPDGPAFQENPTPITCEVERGHEGYIQPAGTFRSPFIRKVAKHFFPQVKGSVLEPVICAANPPKGLYALLLVSVERAFTAFKSGSYMKPKKKFSHESYRTHLETYVSHLDAVSLLSWEKILGQVTASDMNTATADEAADAFAMSVNRRNLVVVQ